jgi:phosphatidylserine decarboxylase
VQPVVLERYPAFTLNRRSWCAMDTAHFGTVVQTEIGALVVGGIVNHRSDCAVRRGEEKGHFAYGGSTIVLLLRKDAARILPEILAASARGEEFPVRMGQRIGTAHT